MRRPQMQGLMFFPQAWEVMLTTEEARARAVRPLRGRIEAASAELATLHLELAEFHRAHCGGGQISGCAVCMGRR